MKVKGFIIGTDPEFFLIDTEGNPYPAIGLIGGTKRFPRAVTSKGHAIQEDNVSVEFNVPPTNDSKQMFKDIRFVIQQVRYIIPEELKILIAPSAEFDPKYLQSPQAINAGCDPSFNAWTGEINRPSVRNTNLRTSAAHIHIGSNLTIAKKIKLIKAMDLFLGVPSILMDSDTERRKLYGKAGDYREQRWGVEYRVLGNFWIRNQELVDWTFKSCQRAFNFMKKSYRIYPADCTKIQNCINKSDKNLADYLCKKYNIELMREEVCNLVTA